MTVRASAAVPTSWMDEQEVRECEDYSTRAPTDYVVSGPICGEIRPLGSIGRGRVFDSADLAEEWARNHFGSRFRGRIKEAERGARWAMLISRG